MALGNPQVKVTKHRRTVITLNQFQPSEIEKGIGFHRGSAEIGQGVESKRVNVLFRPGIGWQLRPFEFLDSSVYEREDAQPRKVELTVPESVVEAPEFAPKVGVGLFTYGAASQGAYMHQKHVVAGASLGWAAGKLAADMDAYPGPTFPDAVYDMDRIAVSTTNHEPDESVSIRFYVPESATATPGLVLCFYFCGPAGSNGELTGIGQYGLEFYGDGLAKLFERNILGTWKKRYEFQYSPAKYVRGATHKIEIVSDGHQDDTGKWTGSKIQFWSQTNAEQGDATSFAGRLAGMLFNLRDRISVPIYTIPRKVRNSTTLAPNRVDIRRDIRAKFGITKNGYPEEGTLEDEAWSTDFEIVDTETLFRFEWYARIPARTTLTAKLYNSNTGDELSGTIIRSDSAGGQIDYVPVAGQRHYHAKFFFTSEGDRTPTLDSFRIYRNPSIHTPDVEPFEIQFRGEEAAQLPLADLLSVDIDGPSNESADESAKLVLNDYTGDLQDPLLYQTMIPITVETTFDAPGEDKAILFRGYVDTVDATRKSGDKEFDGKSSYTGKVWHQFDLNCVGEWTKLMEALAPKRFVWIEKSDVEGEADKPARVTRMIYLLLRWAGYPDEMIDVPELPIRLFSTNDDEYVIEPGTPIADVIASLAQDYLGGWLIFDASCGTYGMWRVIMPQQAPYNILAKFDTRNTLESGTRLSVVDGAYGTATGTGDFTGQTILKTFVRKGTFGKKRYKAEGNVVSVFGYASGEAASSAGQTQPAQLTATRWNANSANFANLDSSDPLYPRPSSTNPDYRGHAVPIKVYDPTLTTQAAVDWVCNRVFDYACVSREHWTFDAPLLLVTDTADPLQDRKRPLRFYDAVEVYDDVLGAFRKFLVLRCTPSYTQDNIQMASYEVVTSSVIDQFPVMPSLPSYGGLTNRIVQKANGMTKRSPRFASAQRQLNQNSKWMGFPEVQGESLQVSDTASPHYGKAIFMVGYHPVGGTEAVIGPV